jgi:hypothetical protein
MVLLEHGITKLRPQGDRTLNGFMVLNALNRWEERIQLEIENRGLVAEWFGESHRHPDDCGIERSCGAGHWAIAAPIAKDDGYCRDWNDRSSS